MMKTTFPAKMTMYWGRCWGGKRKMAETHSFTLEGDILHPSGRSLLMTPDHCE